mgnify:CR=1 FL=1
MVLCHGLIEALLRESPLYFLHGDPWFCATASLKLKITLAIGLSLQGWVIRGSVPRPH